MVVGQACDHSGAMSRPSTLENADQMSLVDWAEELEHERERIAEVNERRAASRGFLVFATDPERSPDESGYRDVYATEARTPGEAAAKIRPLAGGRRLRTYLATGTYKHELADARWVA